MFEYDPDKINFSTRTLTILQINRRIDLTTLAQSVADGNNPWAEESDYSQEGLSWNVEDKSLFIESLLIRIPAPTLYFDGVGDGDTLIAFENIQVIDTLLSFINDELFLEGLQYLKSLNGCCHNYLPPLYQRRFDENQFTCHIIENGTPPDVKFNLMKRIKSMKG